jgi:hypothetical protein
MTDLCPTAHVWGLNEVSNITPAKGKDLLILDQHVAYLATVRKLQVPVLTGLVMDSAFFVDGFGAYRFQFTIPPATEWITVMALTTVDDASTPQYWRSRLSVDDEASWSAWSKVPCTQNLYPSGPMDAGWTTTTPDSITNPLTLNNPHSHSVAWGLSYGYGILQFECTSDVKVHSIYAACEIKDMTELDR